MVKNDYPTPLTDLSPSNGGWTQRQLDVEGSHTLPANNCEVVHALTL